MDEFVTITIGIGCLSCGVFKPVKGKSLPLKVKKRVSAEAILDEALKKRSSYDRIFRNDKTYKQCFPDGNEVKGEALLGVSVFACLYFSVGLRNNYCSEEFCQPFSPGHKYK